MNASLRYPFMGKFNGCRLIGAERYINSGYCIENSMVTSLRIRRNSFFHEFVVRRLQAYGKKVFALSKYKQFSTLEFQIGCIFLVTTKAFCIRVPIMMQYDGQTNETDG